MIVSTPIAKSLLRSIYKGPAFRGIWQMVRLAPHPELVEGEGRPACAKSRFAGRRQGGDSLNNMSSELWTR